MFCLNYTYVYLIVMHLLAVKSWNNYIQGLGVKSRVQHPKYHLIWVMQK